MSHPILIEVAGEDAGILAPLRRGYAFYAASRRFHPLEGRTFSTPWHAEKAARDLAARRPPVGCPIASRQDRA
jgi:hypothetical protein